MYKKVRFYLSKFFKQRSLFVLARKRKSVSPPDEEMSAKRARTVLNVDFLKKWNNPPLDFLDGASTSMKIIVF